MYSGQNKLCFRENVFSLVVLRDSFQFSFKLTFSFVISNTNVSFLKKFYFGVSFFSKSQYLLPLGARIFSFLTSQLKLKRVTNCFFFQSGTLQRNI